MKIIKSIEEIPDDTPSDVLYSKEKIHARVRGLAEEINDDYAQKDLVIICVLASGLVFTADLMRAIQRPLELGFMRATSYSKGQRIPVVVEDFLPDRVEVANRHVLIVDGISESGNTFAKICSLLNAKEDGEPKSIKTCVFARKRNQERNCNIDYCGIVIPNCLVYGYGINHMGKRRNEPNLKRITQKNFEVDFPPLAETTMEPIASGSGISTSSAIQMPEDRVEKIDRLITQLSREWNQLREGFRNERG